MPIYEYICQKCNKMFSVYGNSISSQEKPKCPECSSNDIKKMPSSCGIASNTGGG